MTNQEKQENKINNVNNQIRKNIKKLSLLVLPPYLIPSYLIPHTSNMDTLKIVLILRHGGRRDHNLRWDATRCLPCETSEWMDLVGPTTNNCVLTAHIDEFSGSELVDIYDGSVDIILDIRGLTSANDHGHRIFWEMMTRKLAPGGSFLGCKSVFTRRRKFLDGVRGLFQGPRDDMRSRAGIFKIFSISTPTNAPRPSSHHQEH